MPLSVVCPECGTRYNVPDKLAGKRAKCKKCGATLAIPAPAAPASAEIGFAPEDESLAAMRDLARATGEDAAPDVAAPDLAPGAPRRRGTGVPAGWTPESVIVEREPPPPSAIQGSGRWARKSGGGLARRLVTLAVLAVIVAGGWYVYTNYAGKTADLLASAKKKLSGGAKKSADESTTTASKQQAPPPQSVETDNKRAASADRLRKIHGAVQAYYARTNHNWPSSLSTLQGDPSLDAQTLASPFGPAFASTDYAYKPYPAGIVPGPDAVVAYDNAELSSGEGASVLFGNGDVRWLDKAGVEEALKHTEEARAAAVQQHDQQVASIQRTQPTGPSSEVFKNGDGGGAGADSPFGPRGPGRRDVAERIRAGSQGYARDVIDVAVRHGTEQLVRPATPASAVALLVRGGQGDTIEEFDGKGSEPVEVAQFQADQAFRNNPGAYALSPDGKLMARLTSFPKLKAVVYSFEKKIDIQSIDLDEKFGEPTIVGFLAADRFAVRWHKMGQYGLEIWDARTGKRGRQINLFEVQPPPGPASEAVSPDGRTYALINKAAPPAGRQPIRERESQGQQLQVLMYDVNAGGNPRRLAVSAVGNAFGIQPAGLAFSPDKARLAALFVDGQGRAVVTEWTLATGKPMPEHVVSEKLDPPAPRAGMGGGRGRALDFVADGRGLLVAGRVLMNADTGDTLAIFDAGKVNGQAVTDDATVHLAHGEYGQIEGLAVVPLNQAKFPEKPGVPNRASASPVK